MLSHAGRAPAPHDLWTAWPLDPLLLLGVLTLLVVHQRGRSSDPRSAWLFRGGLAAVAVALLSPLEVMAGALASAHMVQHVLLVLVAAPMIAASAPAAALLRGLPRRLVVGGAGAAHSLGLTPRRLRVLRQPVVVLAAHVAVLWAWHAAVLYDAALGSWPLHVLEHALFLVTGVLLWRLLVGPHRVRVEGGAALLVLFVLAMSGVFLSALLTFAREAWYAGYATTTARWGLTPLEDQQLAGLLMWIPAGAVHVVIALRLLAGWIRAAEPSHDADAGILEDAAP